MSRKKKGNPLNGWLNVDKPEGLTSTQTIGRIRRILSPQKIGHAGTLDPLATGVLPIALGEATKTIPYAQDQEKIYRFTVTWGEARNTDDMEGEVTNTSDKRPERAEIEALLPRFTGEIEQVPPQFSAIKIDGKRAYAMARAGEDVELKARPVIVYTLDLLETTPDSAIFEMECGKGTYVRSIARDMGEILGCFGHISALRRTAVGVFSENDAITLDDMAKIVDTSGPDQVLLPVETALDDIPALAMTEAEISRIRNGQKISFLSRQDIDRFSVAGVDSETDIILAIGDNKPIGLLEKDGVHLHPVRLFNL